MPLSPKNRSCPPTGGPGGRVRRRPRPVDEIALSLKCPAERARANAPLPALAGALVHQLKVLVVLDFGMVHVHQRNVVVLFLSAGPSAPRRTAPPPTLPTPCRAVGFVGGGTPRLYRLALGKKRNTQSRKAQHPITESATPNHNAEPGGRASNSGGSVGMIRKVGWRGVPLCSTTTPARSKRSRALTARRRISRRMCLSANT